MSESNPSYTGADIITDIEARLSTPNISASEYVPWISYSYQRTFQALTRCDQRVKEELFGDSATINLSVGVLEYTITDWAPRFGGDIKLEVKYGGTGDQYNKAKKLRSVSQWENMDHVDETYRGTESPLYYIKGPYIGIIPTPPESGAVAKLWYVKRPYQITMSTDVIDIPYRFLWPMVEYVHAKAIQRTNEDYSTGAQIENNFRAQLEEMVVSAASEYNENDYTNSVEVDSNSPLFDNPLGY